MIFRCSVMSRMWVSVLALCILCASAYAAGPVFWEVSKQDDVVKGDARGVSISENGTISLAPAFTLVYDTKEAYIWSSTTDAAGNIYLGTGHEGRIFKVDPAGAGKLLFDSPELDVTALTTDAQGNLYAGTSPEGKIYKITPDGNQSVFYDPADKYIWSLVFDGSTSTLFAATGDKGIIYKIDSTGKASVLADTNETNIVSLAIDRSGNLIAGTEPSGLVLRVSREGKTFALFDSPMQEIHSLVVGSDGAIFALGINPQASAQRTGNVGVSSSTSVSSEGVITISTSDDQEPAGTVQTVDMSGSAAPTRGRSSKTEGAKGAVFRISADGGSEVTWSSNSTVGFTLKPLPDGRTLVGTGDKGRIYSVAADRSYTLLVQSREDQTSTIISVGDRLFATSSNLGRLYRLGSQAVPEGTYSSPVHDTKFAGKWGVVTWRGEGGVELQTRSGNTETPDATWSDWSPAYKNALGDQIASPRARFIQWRATLRSQSGRADSAGRPAQLQSVVIAYLPRNQAPEVASVNVLPPGVALQELPLAVDPSISSSGLDPQLFGLTMNVPPRRFFQKGARTITWQASDPNDDTLTYKLFYRTLGDQDWHLLAENLSQSYYTIDGNKLPDGSYVFKVQASDAPGNPTDVALTHEDQTEAIQVDNTPPSIRVSGPSVNGQVVEAMFDVNDSTSRVVRGEFSVDGGAWKLIYPADGIADSAHETFTVKVAFEKSGEHVIAFRCADSSANVGTSKVTVTAR